MQKLFWEMICICLTWQQQIFSPLPESWLNLRILHSALPFCSVPRLSFFIAMLQCICLQSNATFIFSYYFLLLVSDFSSLFCFYLLDVSLTSSKPINVASIMNKYVYISISIYICMYIYFFLPWAFTYLGK